MTGERDKKNKWGFGMLPAAILTSTTISISGGSGTPEDTYIINW